MARGLLELASVWAKAVRLYVLSTLKALLTEIIENTGIFIFLVIPSFYRDIQRLLWKKRERKRPTAALTEKKETIVESIERETGHQVALETSLSEYNLAKCNQQSQCPLFQLPKELRDMILEYASSQSEDLKRRYEETSFYYRPGHTARLKTYTSLLFTCRRVWLEANSLPMKLAEHSFWFQRGPYDGDGDTGWAMNVRREHNRYDQFLRRLTTSNLQNLTYIHVFMQMFQTQQFDSPRRMELFIWDHYLKLGLKPKVFHVTIRQSDWWNWEIDQPLSFDERWVQSILDAPQLGGSETFKLELETLASKKDQLDPIVERLKRLEGNPTTVDPTDDANIQQNRFVFNAPPKAWEWTRSPRLDGRDWPVFKDLKELKLHVVSLLWRKQPSTTARLQNAVQDNTLRNLVIAAGQCSAGSSLPYDTTPVHTPAMIMRMRARRALMNEMKWSQVDNFSQFAASMQAWANEQAIRNETARRERFGRMFGDMEADRLMQQWKTNGSLLKFVGSRC